jgi:putative addiction module component (TIGR02574 family)
MMVDTTLEKLRSAALRLSNAERAQWAHDLVQSLDAPPDADAADARDQGVSRRLNAIEAGTVALIDCDDLRQRLKARIPGG